MLERISSPRSLTYWLIALIVVGVLFGPTLRLQPGAWWRTATFDGHRHVLGWGDVVRVREDRTGVATLGATLAVGLDVPFPASLSVQERPRRDVVQHMVDVLSFTGAWTRSERHASSLTGPTPFIVEINKPTPRLLLVRRANAEHVYATDPVSGNVLYPTKRFLSVWNGNAFHFGHAASQGEP